MQYPQSRFLCRGMRWFALPVLLLMLLLVSGCEKIELERADGARISWEQYRGQWVLVNYWAEWCKPCLEEIPELNELNKAPDIAVLGVNFDGVTGAPLVELGERMGIEFVMLAADPGPGFGWRVPMALPATFVVDPEGTLLEARFGPQTAEDIRQLIGK